MLREVTSREYPDKENRRWFSDDYFDLIVWLDSDNSIRGFQLCYDKRCMERAVTWWNNAGFSHERVDSGENNPEKNRSPILTPDGISPVQDLLGRYGAESTHIDHEVREFVLTELTEYKDTV